MQIKILSYNVHKGVGWLTRKSTLHDIRHQIKDLQPDVIFLQEICDAQFEFLAGDAFPYISYGKNAVYTKGHHGNAILSKFPITYSKNTDISIGRYERRGLLHGIIHPTGLLGPLHLVCVHLGLLKKYRRKQLDKIADYVEEHIPTEQPLIIGGDFNDWRSHASAHMLERLGLQEPFLDRHGAYAKTFPSWMPILKLDRIYVRGLEISQAERLTHRSWKKLSDHIALNISLSPYIK